MGLDDIPLFSMLKGKLAYVNQRQRLISENIANADTPGYAPRDLKPFHVQDMQAGTAAAGAMLRTSAMHLEAHTAPGSGDRFKAQAAPDSETRLDGNQVVLEEQMAKMTEARVDYEASIDFYQQAMNLVTTAARAPGKSS